MNIIRKYISKYEISIMMKFIARYKKKIAQVFVLSLLYTGFTYLAPAINIIIIDNGIANKNLFVLLISVLSLYVVYICMEGVSLVKGKKESKLRYVIKKELENEVIDYCMENETTAITAGEIDALVKQDCAVYTSIVSRVFEEIFRNICSIICILFMLFSIQKVLAVIVITFQIALVVFQLQGNHILEKESIETRSKFIDLMNITNEIIENIHKIVPIGAKKYSKKKYNILLEKQFNVELKQTAFQMKITSIMSLFASLITCVILIVGGIFVLNDRMSVGELLSFSQYSSVFLTPVIELLSLPMEFSENYSSIRSVSQIIKNRAVYGDRVNNGEYDGIKIKQIEIKNLCFAYKKKNIFEDVNVTLKQGIPNYIVGKSGIGKSTLLGLIMGQYHPLQGDILYNDISIKRMDLTTISSYVAYVSQENVIFKDSILNNIVLGSHINMKRVQKICKDCQIWDEIESMKNGLDTMISEQGKNLSGGQKSRICLARALYMNKPIIILDEVTAGLDMKTERKIKNALYKYLREKISVIVTHSEQFILRQGTIFLIHEKKVKKSDKRGGKINV